MINTKNILNYIVLAGLFVTPFIAFIVPQGMFFPFISGKGFAFRILVEILFGVYVFLAFSYKEYRPKFSWLTKSILAFTLIIFVADLLGENVYKSLWSNYERMEGFVLLAHLTLYYLVVSSVLNTKNLWNKFFNTSIAASVIMSIYGLFQLAGWATISQGGVRLDGTFGNSTYLAIYLVFHIFLCLYMFASGIKENWQKWVYGLIIVLETILLYFTATRGAILGFMGGLLLAGLLIIWKEKENKTLRKIFYGILATVAIVIVGFFIFKDSTFVKESPVLSRFSTLSVSEFKTQGRYFVWPMALEGIKERPLLGWGQENFNFVFNKNYNPGMFGQEEWFDRTHNLVLDWLIAGGILGFSIYVSIYVALFYYIWRKKSTLSLSQKGVLTGMVSAYVLHNLFVFDNLISYIIFFSIMAYIHSEETKDYDSDSKFYTRNLSGDVLNYVVLPLVVIFTLATVYFVNVPAILANKTLIKAMSQQSSLDKNLDYFKKVFDYKTFGSSEAVEHLTQSTIKILSIESGVSDKTKQDFLEFTKSKLEEKLASSPHDARYLVFAGGFYNRLGQFDDAIKYLDRAMIESPNKQSIYFELGTSYLGKGDRQKMFELFQKAYELKTSSLESQIIYMVGAIYVGNKEIQDQMAKLIPVEKIINDSRVLKAYSDMGNNSAAVSILNERIKLNPKTMQDRFLLADLYYRMGLKQKSVELIREMTEIDPSFKTQGDMYIQQILAQ